jgi:hypothetical protein
MFLQKNRENIENFLIWTIMIGLIIFMRPYYGIVHDSVLYAGQVLHYQYPEEFNKDLFFAYGSQAQYSIFPILLGKLTLYFSFPDVFLLLTLVARIALFVAFFYFIKVLFNKNIAIVSTLALIILPSNYGTLYIFRYGEGFLSGRNMSESLIILGLAFFIQKKWLLTFLSLLVAIAIHPIMTLPALIVIYVYLCMENKKWLFLMPVGLFLVASACFLSPDIQKTLLYRYDQEWLSILLENNAVSSFAFWSINHTTYLITELFLILSLLRTNVSIQTNKLFYSLIIATFCGFLASYILSDIYNFKIIRSIQLWRVQWLTHAFSIIAAAALCYKFYKDKDISRLFLICAITYLGSSASISYLIGPITTPVLTNVNIVYFPIVVFLLWPIILTKTTPNIQKIILGTVGLLVISFVIQETANAYFTKIMANLIKGEPRFLYLIFKEPINLFLMLFSIFYVSKKGSKPLLLSSIIAIAFLSYSAINYDQRRLDKKMIESSLNIPFSKYIPPGSIVFWEGDLLASWLGLKRNSYYQPEQVAGALFNRGNAFESKKRANILFNYFSEKNSCLSLNDKKKRECYIDMETVIDTCKNAQPYLNYWINEMSFPLPQTAKWAIIEPSNKKTIVTYYLYSCNDLMKIKL